MPFYLADDGKACWALPESISWIISGHPSKPLPSRGGTVQGIASTKAEAADHGDELARPEIVRGHVEVDKEFVRIMEDAVRDPLQDFAQRAAPSARRRHLDLAERELGKALEQGRLIASGRQAPCSFVRPSDEIFDSEIVKIDLCGTLIIVGSALSPPRESWLVTADRITGAGKRAWFDVQIPVDQIRASFRYHGLGNHHQKRLARGWTTSYRCLQIAEAYRHPYGDGKIGWDRRQIIDWYLGKHPTLAEHIQWHIKRARAPPLFADCVRCVSTSHAASIFQMHLLLQLPPRIGPRQTDLELQNGLPTESAAFEGRRMEPRCRQAGSVAKKQRRRRSKIRQFAAELAN